MRSAAPTCPVPFCLNPEEGTGCIKGSKPYTACPFYQGRTESPRRENLAQDVESFPWTGNSLGQATLELVAARGAPKLLGVVGPTNAGKTMFLTMIYLLLHRGIRLKGRTFAGSYTIEGWENLASELRFGSWDHPRFPQHTSAAGGRQPGLLHLAFRGAEHRLEDVLLTDAPGEWFTNWMDEPASAGAEGARWIAERAAAFLLFVDSAALSGSRSGAETARLRRLAERVGLSRRGGRVAVVWSKVDHQVSPVTEARLRATFERSLPGCRQFRVASGHAAARSDLPPLEGHLEILDWLLEDTSPRFVLPFVGVEKPRHPFFRYGAHG